MVGGRNSNNTRRLVQLCHQQLKPAIQVECVDELEPEWFKEMATVGLTAGTSTLDETIDAVERKLEELTGRQAPGESSRASS